MTLILLEALAALALLLGIVWWTMFAGRKKGELTREQISEAPNSPPPISPSTPSAPTTPAASPRD